MADKKQRLVYSIIEFLQTSMEDGTIKEDDKEGLEVAVQCISEAYGVDLANEAQTSQLSVKPANLQQIFDVYLKTEAKRNSSSASASSSASTSAPKPAAAPAAASPADAAAADKLKNEGNTLMASKNYPAAIAKYGEAIAKNPSNPVYYSNRAAAHSQAGDHLKAIDDANKAKDLDGSFSKAYSRLGHAYFSLGRYSEAVEAYEKGVELDPNNASMKSSLSTARAKATDGDAAEGRVTSPEPPQNARSPPPAGGAGGNPFANLMGGGGMPDMASLMNNPAMMQMAQQMMGNGGLERLMSNPAIRNMAERMQGGGGMPNMSDIQSLMSDPDMRGLAEQFGRGGAGGAGGSGSGVNNEGHYS